ERLVTRVKIFGDGNTPETSKYQTAPALHPSTSSPSTAARRRAGPMQLIKSTNRIQDSREPREPVNTMPKTAQVAKRKEGINKRRDRRPTDVALTAARKPNAPKWRTFAKSATLRP